jgi:L-fuconolactonase
MPEAIIDPGQRIIDPHHHLWDRRNLHAQLPNPLVHPFQNVLKRTPLYLLDELLADMNSGHNIVATVFIECRASYRAESRRRPRPSQARG